MIGMSDYTEIENIYDEFKGDILNCIPVSDKPTDTLEGKMHYIPWISDLNIINAFDILKIKNSIMMYGDMETKKYLHQQYFSSLHTITENAIRGINGSECASIIPDDSDYTHLAIRVSNKMPLARRLESLLSDSIVFALPVISRQSIYLGTNEMHQSKFICDHVVLCLGKFKDKYLII